ncbi:beta-1,4-N-acetylglucosaminyltransferase [Breznakia sp. PF5-3]|uniref:PssD/Cps14F family polysaccharide biosynthesis glycosyltransferase n=1 Tax=unclassified Breznakia TaxID=2623764 RepID=UPI002405A71B|nr:MULTISPECIES: PssD/Cps14F family polysaccharide biosynthesis glycosyltransferase [unclassified Breznakia]MDF9824973.1 beta-1,4-N-acetylglucosaminyltransferase [Breznakia sp. PM6-1]MDF9835834.1 beta-1,4-N-acetylglucosaminyltransferase [Breznakia sp. PF5-3]MDF9836914.1 beta-1,4-N-acetylglucosaminyltransferase [Breznakia sp. PFB2-8]MDF9859860.1 beta-1,4-N-acetylglucosaminyltransferase [Breznakia sp. PH5-24]
MKKVMFISSTGGHLSELLQLKRIFSNYDYHIVTEKTKSNISLIKQYHDRISFLAYGTKHNLFVYAFVFPWNCFKSIALFFKYRPDVVVTTGAHTAVPMCYIAKLFRKKIIFIETFANIHTRTLSGRIVYPIADVFVVQWESMLELYPKAIYGGWIF